MPKKGKNRRRKYFVDRRVQGMWALMNLIVAGLIVLLVGVELLRSFYVQFGWPLAGQPFELTDLLFILKLIVIVIIGSSLFWILSAYASHRIAGPIYRLNKSLIEVSKGNYKLRIKFRKNDYFQDVASTFNRMVQILDTKVSTNQKAIESIASVVESLPDDNPGIAAIKSILENANGEGVGKQRDSNITGTDSTS